LYRATFSDRGARLVEWELKRYASGHGVSDFAEHPGRRPHAGQLVGEGDRVELGGQPALAVDLGSGPRLRSLADCVFTAADSTDATGAIRALTFTGRDSSGAVVRETWRVRPETYLLDLEVAIQGAPAALTEYSLTARSWPLTTESNPQLDLRSLRAISLVGTDLHRDGAGGLVKNPPREYEGAAHWAGVQTHYFVGMVAAAGSDGRRVIESGDWRDLTPAERAHLPADVKPRQEVAQGTLVMSLPAGVPQRFAVYFGPADYNALAKLSGAGHAGSLQLQRAVDMGMQWLLPFSYPLLQLMRGINRVVRNYGLAILILATLVRLVLHPLNMASMRSMRAMQKLQPEIERIRERHKHDATAMNAAMMALYKENNVNPAGGCLPMVVQMPLFFALYAVLYNAIELRQAPLVAWIHDLSAPDLLTYVGPIPIRILPLIMAGTGYLSQRLTPTDPRQAPSMYLMNVFMLFIFYNLPSGLVFYWTVMNLFTAIQQWLARRGDDGVVVVPVAAGSGRRKR
ncbi:MAG TPA: YidC/Oxa1 family insertase periplasmic-domain containing protein, partial [Candidatus Eisenbacteria bacterium]|nr:YidC/Oxa1 family insertase periplasmic-domain containing protein [Candidatus Eisenbacteria bacterium]